jgi:hypothetical protein
MTVPGLSATNHQVDLLWALAASLERASDQVRSIAMIEPVDWLDHVNDMVITLKAACGPAENLGLDLYKATTSALAIKLLCAALDEEAIMIDRSALLSRAREEAATLVGLLYELRLDVTRRMGVEFGETRPANEQARRAPLRVSLRIIQVMVRLLPRVDRALYRELYRSELSELAQTKRGRRAQIGYTVRALVRVWSLRRVLAAEAIGEVDQA